MHEILVQFLGKKIPWRRNGLPTPVILGFSCGSTGRESACNAGDLGSVPGLGGSPGGGRGNPLQYFCLENPHGHRSLAGSQRVRYDWGTKHRWSLISSETNQVQIWDFWVWVSPWRSMLCQLFPYLLQWVSTLHSFKCFFDFHCLGTPHSDFVFQKLVVS